MSSSTHLRAANAVRAGFFAEGFCMGVWGAHVPSAAQHYGLDEAGLSLALLMSALGALASVTQAGSVVAQFGARRVALLAGLTMCGALGLVLVPNAFAILGLLMFAFGAATALFDVAINAEGSQIEAASGRKLMSGFHGMFSLGGMAAAATVAGLLRLGWTPLLQIALLAAAMALLVLAGVQGLPQLKPDPQPRKPFKLPRGPLALVGVLTGVAFVAEGAMYDWSALYLS